MEAGRRTLIRRALLAAALWLGFWGVGLAVPAVLLWVPFAQLRYGGELGLAGVVAGVGALVVLWALRPRGLFSRSHDDGRRVPLATAEHPELHALVARVARESGAPSPEELQLIDQASAFIAVERRWFGLRKRYVVGLGLPLFALLTKDELASVLAHELGHQTGHDLALGPWLYRTRSNIGHAIGALEGSAFFLDVPFRAYSKLFLRVTASVSREQELAADAQAARLCGGGATGRALRKVAAFGPLWDAYLEQDLVPLIETGLRPPVIEGFRRFLAQGARRRDVEKQLAAAAAEPPSVWDTHPPVAQRLQALGVPLAPGDLALPEDSCLALLHGERAVDEAWYPRATHGDLVALGWDELAAKVLLPEMEKAFTGSLIDPKRTPLDGLLAHLKAPDAVWELVRPRATISLWSPASRQRRVNQALASWLAAALFARGFEPELRPGGYLLLKAGEVRVEAARWVERLAEGAVTEEEFRAACATWEAARAPPLTSSLRS